MAKEKDNLKTIIRIIRVLIRGIRQILSGLESILRELLIQDGG